VLFVPLVALGTMFSATGEEPSAPDMQAAFTLSMQDFVASAVEFVSLSGGPEALAQVQQNQSDRFSVRSFEKLDCFRDVDGTNFVCAFRVNVDVMNETLRRTMSGRFRPTADGLTFERHDPEV
jgi:hypothetical protein